MRNYYSTFSIPITDCITCGSFTCTKLQNYYSKPIITLNQQVYKSTDMRLLYLNQGSQFETWLCSCVRYLLGELCRPNSSTQLESGLVKT